MNQPIQMNTLSGCYDYLISRGYIPVTDNLLTWKCQNDEVCITYDVDIQKYLFSLKH